MQGGRSRSIVRSLCQALPGRTGDATAKLLAEVGGRGMNEKSGRCEVVGIWEVWFIGEEGRGKRRFGMYSVGRNV